MTIEEYKGQFDELFLKLWEEHGRVRHLRMESTIRHIGPIEEKIVECNIEF